MEAEYGVSLLLVEMGVSRLDKISVRFTHKNWERKRSYVFNSIHRKNPPWTGLPDRRVFIFFRVGTKVAL